MVKNFALTNLSTNSSMTFGQKTSSECLYKDDGIDWGSAPASHNTFSYPSQLGQYISSTVIKGRTISIAGYVYYIPSELDKQIIPTDELKEFCYRKMLEKKSTLNAIVNPTQFVRITIGDYYIEGKPQQSISYGSDVSSNNEFFCAFMISIFCNNPMFRRTQLPNKTLKGVTPAFKFPLVFPRGSGVIMSVRTNYNLIAVENEGDTPTGCIIQIKSNGLVSSPTITNLVTGEHITINKTLIENEVIEINTNDGNEKGIKGLVDDEELNYFRYWDFENTWMKFNVGTSLLGYSVEEGDISMLDITITVNPLKYALEEM